VIATKPLLTSQVAGMESFYALHPAANCVRVRVDRSTQRGTVEGKVLPIRPDAKYLRDFAIADSENEPLPLSTTGICNSINKLDEKKCKTTRG